MADVFISYAREDRARAEQVARGLEAMGLNAFWDTDIPPGQTWADYIEGKLGVCKAVVVLWSQHSTKSQWVREEARMGRDKSKLIPAIIDGASPPLGFGEVQAANLANWNGQTNDVEWTRFANAVHYAVRGADAAAPQPAPAPQPQAQPRPAYTPPPSSTAGAAASSGNPVEYITKCLRLYVDGKGRARRSEYGWFYLFVFVAGVVAYLIDYAFGFNSYTGLPNAQIVSGLVGLALIAPMVSVMSRRLHDIGQNGWLAAAPIGLSVVAGVLGPFGAVLSLIALAAMVALAFIPGQPGENQYGPDPKAA